MLDLETQLAGYGTILEEAADVAELVVVDREPRVIDLAGRRPRRGRLAAAVVLLVAVVAAGAFLLLRSMGSTTNRSIVADGGQRGVIVDVPLPEGVPSDWKTVEYDGVRISVPPTWTLLPAGECPGRKNTILTGAAGKRCAAPKDGTWVWLAPAALATERDRRNCGDSQVGSMAVCGILPSKADDPIERELMVGTDSMFIGGSGVRAPAAAAIRNSLRPADGTTPGNISTDYYPSAVQFLDVYLKGDCAAIKVAADRSYKEKCPKPSALLGADGSAPKVQSSRSTQGWGGNDGYVRLILDDTHAYEVRLRHQWSSAEQRAVWKAVAIKTVDPAEAWPTGPIGAPECIPVGSVRGDTPGCIHRDDEFAGDPVTSDTHQAELIAKYGGTPVYKNAKSTKIVGVMAPSVNNGLGLGFVPQRLVPKIPQLQACADTWLAHAQDPTQPAVDATCRALLVDYGLKDEQINGKS